MRFRWSRKNDHSSRRCLSILGIFTLLSVAKASCSGRRSNCKSRYHFRAFPALCAPFGERMVLRYGQVPSARSVRFREGAFTPFLDLKTNCIFFMRCIVFLVQIAYNDSANREGMISWLELQQTSASEWTAI